MIPHLCSSQSVHRIKFKFLQEQFFNAALDAYVSINFLFGMDLSLSDKGSNKVNGW